MKSKELAVAFTIARQLIYERRNDFICYALDSARCELGLDAKTVVRAKKIIGKRLEGYATLGLWLESKHGIFRATSYPDRLRRTRLAWLDSLIKEFS